MRDLVRLRRYVVTAHAVEEMDADGLSLFDVESCLLVGRIIERQVDRTTGQRKYLVKGRSLDGDELVVAVVKISPTGKLVLLTIYTE
ncbi:MAG: DUF4258 domain-containing protein [Acidobacteria bacterium]|nr:DUF4258 domain-containing protein [Acidobacteriota bacterium]